MKQKGFTLLEILLVIAAIGILAAIVIVAINPSRQLSQVRDTERQSEVNQLFKALGQYSIDNGEYPVEIDAMSEGEILEICRSDAADCTGLLNITSALTPTYVSGIPTDPNAGVNGTGYFVYRGTRNRIGIAAREELTNEYYYVGIDNWIPLLRAYPNAAVAYSLRRLDDEYSGSVIRVRRSSDNTEQDIGFTDQGLLDESALTSFVGGGDGFVSVWYDQSGNGHDATQTTQANQPQIVVAGVIVVNNSTLAMNFDEVTTSYLEVGTYSWVTSGALTYSVVATPNSGANGRVLSNSNNRNILRYTDANVLSRYNFEEVNGAAISGTSLVTIFVSETNFTQPFDMQIFVDGILSNDDSFANGSDPLSSVFRIGAQTSTSAGFDGTIQEIVFYESDQSTNRENIENNINSFYEIF